MERYLALISGFLQKEESCYLPGLGVLKVIRRPARPDNGQLQPPKSEVLFDPKATEADHSIVSEIQSHFSIPDENATTQWSQCLSAIKKQLQQGTSVQLPAVGYFEQIAEGQIRFITHTQSDYFAPVSFRSAEELATPADAPVDNTLLPEKNEDTQPNKRLWWYVLVPLLVLVVGYFGYRYLFSPPTKDLASDPHVTPTEGTAPPLSTTPSTDSATARKGDLQQPAANVSDSIHFAVIYRVYHEREDADKHYRRMRNWGHAVVLYTPDSGVFLLGYPYYGRPRDTARRLEEIEATYGGKPFVFYPKK